MRGVTNFTAAQQRHAADSGYRRRQSSVIPHDELDSVFDPSPHFAAAAADAGR
jgi:hypothetical protein